MLPVLMTRAGSPSVAPGREHRHQRAGQQEDTLDVDVEYLVEAGFRKLAQRRTPCRAGVVVQRVDRVRPLGEVGNQRLHSVDGAQIGGNGLYRSVRRQFSDGGVQLGLFAAGQVYRRSRLQQAARHHHADATAAAGDHGDLSVQTKHVSHGDQSPMPAAQERRAAVPISVPTPSGDSTRTASSRIRPRSSAVLNSAAISLALRRPLGRSHR